MAFPETRHTLIERLAEGGRNADWREFLNDYWGPVCRFACRRGRLSAVDAEDIAAQTMEAIVRNQLLKRWSANRSARLRTLICTVVCYLLANRARIESGRARLTREHYAELERYLQDERAEEPSASTESVDTFYAAWAADVVQAAVEGLHADLLKAGRADDFRILYGRICDDLTMVEIAAALEIPVTTVESRSRQLRDRLQEKLRQVVRAHVQRYSLSTSAPGDFADEWRRLGEYLISHGGLETAVRESYAQFAPEARHGWCGRVALDDLGGTP